MAKNYLTTRMKQVCGVVGIPLLMLTMAACSKDDTVATEQHDPTAIRFSLSDESLSSGPDASSLTIDVTADEQVVWTVDQPLQEWLSATPSVTAGSGTITLSLNLNMDSKPRQCYLLVRSKNDKYYVEINQEKGINVAPNAPEYLLPEDRATEVCPYPVFSWEIATDPNSDKVIYQISYSKDQQNWVTSPKFDKLAYNEQDNTFDKLTYYVAEKLDENTTYYWYVTAIDSNGLGEDGAVRSFTTGNPAIPADGSYTIYPGSENGTIPLVFMGDGFIPSDYIKGGDFDKKIDQGIEYFFGSEPYKTYRERFKVYKLVAYSREQGISVNDSDRSYPHRVDLDTRFKVRYNGNGYNNTQMVFGERNEVAAGLDFVKQHIPAIKTVDLLKTTVVVVANYWLYGGTCWWSYTDEFGGSSWDGGKFTGHDGTSIAIVPVCEEGRNIPWMNQSGNCHVPFSYEATMNHEAGGHGFGRLADEYKYGWYPAGAWEIGNINDGSQHGYNGNIDVTNDPSQVKWKVFFSTNEIKARYPQVGIYEGAQYTKNVYMSETSVSCMNNMTAPQSTVSREFIVQKIYKALGTPYSFDEFMSRDKADPIAPKSRSASSYSAMGVHHTPPQIVNSK